MIKNKKTIIFIGVIMVLAAAAVFILNKKKGTEEVVKEISPVMGTIQSAITSTAIVQPQNRLEIKPPINGRIDSILVKEGQPVKEGQILVLMSSTERAALLDAARSRGPEALAYWEEVYKPTPLISPIDGEVIVSTDEPGQTVTTADAIVVLSDQLIVQAQVDETDIGKVKVGQEALITLDAYPDIKVRGKVDHIYYESKIVNNVTIYQVDILPDSVPAVFRSGMSATVTIIEKTKESVLMIPVDAVIHGKKSTHVLLSAGEGKKPIEKKVELGIADERNVEVISGLTENDKILEVTKKYVAAKKKASGSSPFMPGRRR